MKKPYHAIRKTPKLFLKAAIPLFFLASHAGAAEERVLSLTDRQDRPLEVIVLAVNGDQIRVRRVADGREFSIPVENLSDESREKLRGFKNPEPTEAAAKPPVEIDLPDEVLAYMRGKWQGARSKIADPELPGAVFHCWQVSRLIALENELVAAATPKDPVSPIDWPGWVAPEVRREAEILKQRIRDMERLFIFREAGLRPEIKEVLSHPLNHKLELADLYDEVVKVHREQRHKAHEALVREENSSRPNAKRMRDCEAKAKTATESISALHKAFYGFSLGEWLRPAPGWPADHPAEILRKEISTLRVTLHERLSANAFFTRESESRDNRIDFSQRPSHPGVILQISPKMMRRVESLRQEYGDAFHSGLYREVSGSNFYPYEVGDTSTMDGRPRNVFVCMEEMIMIHKADTIYWFYDSEDLHSVIGLVSARDLLRMSDARLYIKSISQKTDERLKKLNYPF